MRLGLTLPSFVEDPEVALRVARAAEDAGLDGVFVYDHLFRRGEQGERRPALESVALLGALATATRRVSIGALVFRAWLRPAATLGAAVTTVARLAPRRLVTAIGAGDSQSEEENVTFGLGFGTVDDRVARLEAAVRASRGRGARVWVGGHSAVVRDVAATSADGWNAWGVDPTRFARWSARVRAVAVHEPFECSWGGLAVLDQDDAQARQKAERLGAGPDAVVGGPETVAAALRAYADRGADWIIVGPVDSRDPSNAALLGERVRPLIDARGAREPKRPG